MAVVEGPCTCKNPVDLVKRVDFFDLGGANDFHVEPHVIGNTLHVVKPIEIGLLTSHSNAT